MMNSLLSHIRNRKGQVAIFIALIFQVLFLFFAMIINVGLLVHHKINLQNSVDLAAYYGAMKQAEMMNAVGHVNYQIRQSWKLLAWRYRQLGTAGDYGIHPYKKPLKQIKDDIEGLPTGLSSSEQDYYNIPAFCVTYAPFNPMPSARESTCKHQSELRTINLFSPPPVIAGFLNINTAIHDATTRALKEATDRCRYVGQFNYMILARFMAAYNIDQGERKQLINMLSRGLSEKPDDFREISGDLASQGIIKTFKNNLTEANKNSIKDDQIKIVNGLGQNDCNAVGQANTDPAKWLSEVKIKPAFGYLDFHCVGSGNNPRVEPVPRELNKANVPENMDELRDDIMYLSQFADPLEAPYNASVGVEKNPWCMAYVGVSAETKPSIPFAPLGGVTLKARSFAKPFGGKIGPWYYSQWPRGSNQSSGGKRLDPLLPWREGDKTNQADPKDPTRAANYSRFPGDQAGMKSRVVQGQFARAIFNISQDWSGKVPNTVIDDSLPEHWTRSAEPNFYHWNHLGRTFKVEKSGDILAWDSTSNGYPRMRDLELMAILPDMFDITYYSIDPDFYHNYYLKIANEYVKKVPGFTYVVRPDLGVRMDSNDKKLSEFSIRDQYKVYDRMKTNDPNIPEPKVEFDTKLRYVATTVYQVLTSWIGKDLMDYSIDTERFGKCTTTPAELEKGGPTSGDCVNGGRTGYSVKMVSSDYLRSQDLDLGGDGGATGGILNPPDKDF
jgi:putative Flp pilus-assembly TadE/G-like protein